MENLKNYNYAKQKTFVGHILKNRRPSESKENVTYLLPCLLQTM